jgi:hypothetical protein
MKTTALMCSRNAAGGRLCSYLSLLTIVGVYHVDEKMGNHVRVGDSEWQCIKGCDQDSIIRWIEDPLTGHIYTHAEIDQFKIDNADEFKRWLLDYTEGVTPE